MDGPGTIDGNCTMDGPGTIDGRSTTEGQGTIDGCCPKKDTCGTRCLENVPNEMHIVNDTFAGNCNLEMCYLLDVWQPRLIVLTLILGP